MRVKVTADTKRYKTYLAEIIDNSVEIVAGVYKKLAVRDDGSLVLLFYDDVERSYIESSWNKYNG